MGALMDGSTHGQEHTVLGAGKAQKDKHMPDPCTKMLKDNTRDNDEYQQMDRDSKESFSLRRASHDGSGDV